MVTRSSVNCGRCRRSVGATSRPLRLRRTQGVKIGYVHWLQAIRHMLPSRWTRRNWSPWWLVWLEGPEEPQHSSKRCTNFVRYLVGTPRSCRSGSDRQDEIPMRSRLNVSSEKFVKTSPPIREYSFEVARNE